MTETPQAWHTLKSTDALRALNATAAGLSSQEASGRLVEHGPNELAVADEECGRAETLRGVCALLKRLAAVAPALDAYQLLGSRADARRAAALTAAAEQALDASAPLSGLLASAGSGVMPSLSASESVACSSLTNP